jgi:3-isopropylmalate/(R)-2-methylmalate dehydratase small subunit
MEPVSRFTGLVVALDRENVDTDAIIPKQFMKSTSTTGYGPYLFDSWRYLDTGEFGQDTSGRPVNPDFPLNFPRYRGASVLLARANFGCGSSREHAAWAVHQYGIRAVIAPSFSDIFRNNALKNGLLVVALPAEAVDQLFREVEAHVGYSVTVDLPAQTVSTPDGSTHGFEIDAFRKTCLMQGLDEVALALAQQDKIRAFEKRAGAERPWLYSLDGLPRG